MATLRNNLYHWIKEIFIYFVLMKTKIPFLIILMIAPLIKTFAQERTNRVKLSFDTSSGIITNATGWAYNSPKGEWLDYKNVISSSPQYKNALKSLQGSYMMSKEKQNFIKIQTKTVTHLDSTYYILLVHKWAGRYKYPAIKEDWYSYKRIAGYIFNRAEYNKLINLDSAAELQTYRSFSALGDATEIDILDRIQTTLLETNTYFKSIAS